MEETSKRSKVNSEEITAKPASSKILKPFRTVGIVSNGVPSAVSTLGQNYIVSTVVGRSIQIYDASSSRLLFMTQPQADSDIECIYTHFHHVFAVAAGKVSVYRRGVLEASADIPAISPRQKATKVVVFGGYVCVCVPKSAQGDAAVHVYKWSKPSSEYYTSLTTPSLLGNIVDIAHMPTYVNKLLVATESSSVSFNVKTGKSIHTFNEISEGIIKIEACPTALDKVAVVTTNGDILSMNVRTDRELFRLTTGEPITAISFRSDVGAESAAMSGIGTANGDVFFYSSDLRRRIQSLRGLGGNSQHTQHAIASVTFLPGQALALVTGSQNSLIELVFDPVVTSKATTQSQQQSVQQRARILRERGGHGLPPSSLLFADEEAHFVLSSSLDGSLWAFSLRKDSQSHAFGGSSISNKSKAKLDLAPIVSMAYTAEKADRWDTLVTCHKGSNEARTWSVKRGALGHLKLASLDGSIVKSVAVSPCGNFGLVGSSQGSIAIYNSQSGILRMAIPKAHKSAVTGLALTPNNATLMSCSLDGDVKFHKFGGSSINTQRTPELLSTLSPGLGAITDLKFHEGSGLLCASTDSMALLVVDTTTKKVVRELWGHGNRITSFDFIPSGRWILSASLDHTIRVWDVPTGACINGVRISNVVTNLRVSKDSEWVATSHVRGVGIQMWALQTLGSNSFRNINEEDIIDIDMPTVGGENGISLSDASMSKEDDEERSNKIQVELLDSTKPQLKEGLITLSGKPRNKFTTLIHLDAIRERNKPTVGVKKPEKQPFFLGSPSDSKEEKPETEVARQSLTTGELSNVKGSFESKFTHLLAEGKAEESAEHLTELGPAATDLEIRSIDTREPFAELIAFIDCMTSQLESGKRFELVQAWMNMALRSHADVFADRVTERLQSSFDAWLSVQKKKVGELQESHRFCSGVLNYLRQL